MKALFLIRGIPGCGKSTLAEVISASNGAKICTADDFFMKDGEYKWNPALIGTAHKWCKDLCKTEMELGNPVIVANTTTTEKEVKAYTDLAKFYEYKVFSMVVENRHGGVNEHNVPEEVIEKMKNRFSIKL